MSQDFYMGNPNLKKVGTEIEFTQEQVKEYLKCKDCLLYTSPSPRDRYGSRMPSSA